MSDKLFEKIESKVQEIYAVTPTDLGIYRLTKLYKLSTGPLKVFPLRIILPISIGAALAIYFILGLLVTRLASILQYGF